MYLNLSELIISFNGILFKFPKLISPLESKQHATTSKLDKIPIWSLNARQVPIFSDSSPSLLVFILGQINSFLSKYKHYYLIENYRFD